MDSTNGNTIAIFVFGFLILASFAFGFLIVCLYELTLPYNAMRLYKRLDNRNVDVSSKKVEFTDHGKPDEETIINGFVDIIKKDDKQE